MAGTVAQKYTIADDDQKQQKYTIGDEGPNTATVPGTKPEETGISGFGQKLARGESLGALSGFTGLAESQSPVRDALRAIGSAHPSNAELLDPTGGALGGLYQFGKGLVGAGKETVGGIASRDPEQFAHGIGQGEGILGQVALGELGAEQPSRLTQVGKGMLVDAAGKPTPLAKLTIGGERARALGELANPENSAYEQKARDLMRRGKEQEALDRQAARQAKQPGAEPPATEGPAAPTAQVIKLPPPREPLPGENPGYMASIPRGRLLDLGRQGRPGAGEQLRNIGKTTLYVPEGGYAPPRESINLASPTVEPKSVIAPPSRGDMNLSQGEDLGPGLGTEHTIEKGGKRVGSVTVEPKGEGTLHVHWLGGDLADNGITRGHVIDSLKEQYPGTEKITYDRRRLAKGGSAATTEPRTMNLVPSD